MQRGGVAKTSLTHSALGQALGVDVRGDHLLVVGEAFRLCLQVAVLVDERVAVPSQVCGRFSRARGRIKVSCNALAGLAGAQVLSVVGLADRDVRGRQIREYCRTRQRRVRARRDRRPHVLADFHVKSEPFTPAIRRLATVASALRIRNPGPKQQIVAEWDRLPQEGHLLADRVACRAELPLLVKLSVVGQIGLGRDSENAASVDYDPTVEQAVLKAKRRANQENRRQLPAGLHNLPDTCCYAFQERFLLKEIVDGVRGYAQFREQGDRCARLRSLPGQPKCMRRVELRVRNAHVRNADRHPDKAMPIYGEESVGHLVKVIPFFHRCRLSSYSAAYYVGMCRPRQGSIDTNFPSLR